jgi:NADH-quinone oxidoreductase subunit H
MLAETNRTPFDLPEAESELVAGYNVEYRGVLFSLFFLAEYANMILMAVLFSILFLGGWMPLSIVFFGVSTVLLPGSLFFIVKVELILAFFILARAALPRVRYDQLMILG